MKRVFVLLGALGLAVLLAAPAAFAVPPEGGGGRAITDNLPNPLAEKQAALREEALEKRLGTQGDGRAQSRAASQGNVARVGKNQYVELAREDTDRIFTILVEFGGEKGPLHNQIPRPDRSVDNTTIWKPDFSRQSYQELFFDSSRGANSMANYYEEQSSGRYSVEGGVSNWVRLDADEAEYGTNDCDGDGDDDSDNEPNDADSNVCSTTWGMVRDGLTEWVERQRAAGRTRAQIEEYISRFDEWDRYDGDGDGDFDEPDGYIDHFQIVHAGEGEETGGGAQGRDAVWSHRWYADYSENRTGPSGYPKLGGYEIPGTDVWVGDYTTEPENGGLGVFAHEFGHDLGLPDEYDTSYTGESPSAFWTLMASGSYMNNGVRDAIGTRPNHLNAWDKLQLGWLNYEVAEAARRSNHRLGPAEYNNTNAQALVTVLPPQERTIEVNEPFAGEYEWWSGSGDNLGNTLTRTVDLPAASAAGMSMKAWYEIEAGYDYLYAEASTDGGENWTALPGTVDGQPIDTVGTTPALSGSSGGEWVDLAYDLSPYAGQSVQVRLRYQTDGAVAEKGFAADNISVTAGGQEVFADGAETGDNGWTPDGFRRITGSVTGSYPHYYMAENRQYIGYDRTLRTGPYNFKSDTYAERFPYQNGLLVSYWNTFYNDNNVGEHPGEGLILPIDAHPRPILQADGAPWRTRVQVFDATFGKERTDQFSLSTAGGSQRFPARAAVDTFDDSKTYWYGRSPDSGVKVPDTNTTIRVADQSRDGANMLVEVRRAP